MQRQTPEFEPAPSSAPEPATAEPVPGITRGLVWLLAVACAVAVGNIYYNQPLLPEMAGDLHLSERQVGLVATFAQVGYGLGILFFVPLGDLVERRKLIFCLLLAAATALVGEATAKNLGWLAGSSLAIGLTSVGAQIILPFAAELAEPGRRGKVVGTIMGGLLLGVLLARTVSGEIGQHFGWRAVYRVAAGLTLALAFTLALGLPARRPSSTLPYRKLMASLGDLLRQHADLRESSAIGAMLFGAFSAFWTTLAFLLRGAPYRYGSEVTGGFGLIGAAGALAAPLAGRFADHRGPRFVVGCAIAVTFGSFAMFWWLGLHLWGLVLGVVLMDMGVQAGQVSNQTRIYSLAPKAQSRVNTVYMFTYFVGGALGSALGTQAWGHFRWPGVCAVGLALVAAAGIVHAVRSRKELLAHEGHEGSRREEEETEGREKWNR